MIPPLPQKPYRRLPGRGLPPMAYRRVWQGDDHLLAVENFGFSEHCKRFYFRDIEAIVVTPDGRRTGWAFAFAVPAVLGLPLLFLSGLGWNIFGGLLAGFFGLLLVIHLARGPTCTTVLCTRVNRQRLPSLGRVRVADRFLRIVQPLLDQAQGAYAMDAHAAVLAAEPPVPNAEAVSAFAVPAAGAATPARTPPPLRGPDGPVVVPSLHRIAIALLAVEAVASGLTLALPERSTYFAVFIAAGALCIMVIAALVRQAVRRVSPKLRRWTWIAFWYLMARSIVIYIWGMAKYIMTAATNPEQIATDWTLLLFNTWIKDSTFLVVFNALVVLASLALLAMGLAATRRVASPPLPRPPPLPDEEGMRKEV